MVTLSPSDQEKVWKHVLQEKKAITGALVTKMVHKVTGNGHPKPKVVKVPRAALCRAIMAHYEATKQWHKLAGKALLCKIVAYIRRYE